MNHLKTYRTELSALCAALAALGITWAVCPQTSAVPVAESFVFFASFVFMRKALPYAGKRDGACAALSVLFAGLFVACYACRDGTNLKSLFKGAAVLATCCRLLLLALIFYLCLQWLLAALNAHVGHLFCTQAALCLSRHFLLFGFCILLLCWLPWLLMNYPGTLHWDAEWQLMQALGTLPMTGHHPPFSSFIMGALYHLGNWLWNPNFGCFLYILFHALFGAWVFALGIRQLYAHGLRLRWCLAGLAFFALTPLWGCFVQWNEKDLLFAEACTLFLICLIDLLLKKSCGAKDALALAATGLLAALLRNNGIYAVAPSVLALAFYVDKKSRKAVWLSLLATLLIYGGIVKWLYPSVLGIADGSVREALSIPFQQTAKYVTYYGDEVTAEEKAAIDAVLDYDSLTGYRPWISDPVKDTYKEDGSKLPAYFKVWFLMFWKHPELYASALFGISYGYLAPVQTNIEAWVSLEFTHYPQWIDIGLYRVFPAALTEPFQQLRSWNLTCPVVKVLCAPGAYTWLVLVCLLILFRYKQRGAAILLIPGIMNILICVAAPLATSIRYALPTVAAAPFVLGWTLYFVDQAQKTTSKEEPTV